MTEPGKRNNGSATDPGRASFNVINTKRILGASWKPFRTDSEQSGFLEAIGESKKSCNHCSYRTFYGRSDKTCTRGLSTPSYA